MSGLDRSPRGTSSRFLHLRGREQKATKATRRRRIFDKAHHVRLRRTTTAEQRAGDYSPDLRCFVPPKADCSVRDEASRTPFERPGPAAFIRPIRSDRFPGASQEFEPLVPPVIGPSIGRFGTPGKGMTQQYLFTGSEQTRIRIIPSPRPSSRIGCECPGSSWFSKSSREIGP